MGCDNISINFSRLKLTICINGKEVDASVKQRRAVIE